MFADDPIIILLGFLKQIYSWKVKRKIIEVRTVVTSAWGDSRSFLSFLLYLYFL